MLPKLAIEVKLVKITCALSLLRMVRAECQCYKTIFFVTDTWAKQALALGTFV
jgi:hypothetical protein